jgi:hypothetical protein
VLTLLPLRLASLLFILDQIVDASDVSWVKPSSEAPGSIYIYLYFVSPLAKIIIHPNILIHH